MIMGSFSRNKVFSGWTIKIVVLFSLATGIVLVTRSPLVATSDIVATAAAVDLVITLPLLYYVLIRKTAVPTITIIPVFVICVLLASLLLPAGNSGFLDAVWMYGIPAAEVFVVGYLLYRVFRTRTAYLNDKLAGLDLMERLRTAVEKELRPAFLARAVAFEMGTIAIAFFKWRRPTNSGFTYHKRNGPIVLLSVFLFLLIVETTIMHAVLARWSVMGAWVITGLSIYVAVQIMAHLKALALRPIEISEAEVRIRCGILGDSVIDRSLITAVEKIAGGEADDGGALRLLPLGTLSQPNVRIDLCQPISGFVAYGIERKFRRCLLSVDDVEAFVERLSPE